MKHYSCPMCGSGLAFEALSCSQCKTELGYVFKNDSMTSLRNLPAAARCPNRDVVLCNWIVDPVVLDGNTLCPCCRYTRTIPPQQQAENRAAWNKLERAKRYLLCLLKSLGLSPPDRIQQPATGLAFDFLSELPDQSAIFTAHASGVITINVTEADDAKREQRRSLLNEPYRTLLGHLQHEVGHFYWDQFIANSVFLDKYRSYFGDERQDYNAALQGYYKSSGLNDSWRDQFVSRYASSHPWEDWAETWAYYLHVRDALDTAATWNVKFAHDDLAQQKAAESDGFHQLTSTWPQLCEYLNAVFRSTGMRNEYPSKLPGAVIAKLEFIHHVINESANMDSAAPVMIASQAPISVVTRIHG